MRPGSIVGKVHSGTSVRSAPSIPRREAAQMFAQTKLGFSQLVVKIEWGVTYLEKVRGNAVKTPQAELDLAEYFDMARVWLQQLLQKNDKAMLRSIFEGDAIELLAHLESLCFKVELKVSDDKRRLDLVQRIAACNEILADLGYAEQPRAELEEETEDNSVEEAVPHLTDAAFLGSQAMAYEQVLDFPAAAETYERATCSLRAAITVCVAANRFKASIGASAPQLENDLAQLQRLESQTKERMEHLQGLAPGAAPVPAEDGLKQALDNIARTTREVSFLWSQTVTKIGEEFAKVAEALSPPVAPEALSDRRRKSVPAFALMGASEASSPRSRTKSASFASSDAPMVAPEAALHRGWGSFPFFAPMVAPKAVPPFAPMVAPMVSMA